LADERIEVLVARDAIAAAKLRDREADLVMLHVAGYSYADTAQRRAITPGLPSGSCSALGASSERLVWHNGMTPEGR
jgi:hypothetical protein